MNERLLDEIGDAVSSRAGLNVTGVMRTRLSRYLERTAQDRGVPVEQYAATARTDRDAWQSLIEELTVQESSFFRDREQFEALEQHVLPALSQPILIWSCGCANGQEPYSLAMLLAEGGYRDASVIATDISAEALTCARAGRYGTSGLRGLSPERRAAWLVRDGEGWSIGDEVRRRVSFALHNIATDPPPFRPGDCQVILCRNVLIYFHQEALLTALYRMRGWLPDGGLLLLGHAESLWQVTDVFDFARIGNVFAYRKPGVRDPVSAAPPPPVRAPVPPPAAAEAAPLPAVLGEVATLMQQGELAMAAGDASAAVSAFRRAAYLDPAHPVAHLQLGIALAAQGESGPAARAYRAARTALRRLDRASSPPELAGYRTEALIRLIDAKLDGG